MSGGEGRASKSIRALPWVHRAFELHVNECPEVGSFLVLSLGVTGEAQSQVCQCTPALQSHETGQEVLSQHSPA